MRTVARGAPIACVLAWVALALPDSALADAGKRDGSKQSPISVSFDAQSTTTTVIIESKRGEVAWADVLKGIARAKGFDDSALDGLLPEGSFELDSMKTRLLLLGITAATEPAIRLRTAPATRQRKSSLVVLLNRTALLASERRIKKLLRDGLLDAFDRDKQESVLDIDRDWNRKPIKKNLVVFVHGLHSSPEWTDITSMRDPVRKKGYPTATFGYANDASIRDAAADLSAKLRGLAAAQPGRRVTVIAKSMGGLVSREALENPNLDPGNVNKLILVATPNQGSALAHFAFGLELWEHLVEKRSEAAEKFYASIEDGLGEAADDLIPGSEFLTTLNGRDRNPRVAYSLFLGNQGHLSAVELTALRLAIRSQKNKNRFSRFFGKKLDGYLADLDEVVDGKGDGAVSIERGRLKGVKDTVILPFDHLGASETSTELRSAILKRL